RPTPRRAPLPPRRPDLGLLHHPIDLHLPDPPAKGLHQPSGELVGHRTRPCDPTEASRQAERLRLADRDGELPGAGPLLQHDVVEQLILSRGEPDDLGDPHLDVANLCGCGHGDLPPSPARQIFLPWPAEGEHLRMPKIVTCDTSSRGPQLAMLAWTT